MVFITRDRLSGQNGPTGVPGRDNPVTGSFEGSCEAAGETRYESLMKLVHARSNQEMADAALLMRGLVESNKQRYPDQTDLLDDYYRGSWFLESAPKIPPEYLPRSGDVIVAYEDNEPVGSVAIHRMDDLHCELKSMFVPEEHRGKGVARALCGEVLDTATELGYKFVRLTTGEKQPEARGLYRKLGFRLVTPWEDDPPDGFDYFEIEVG